MIKHVTLYKVLFINVKLFNAMKTLLNDREDFFPPSYKPKKNKGRTLYVLYSLEYFEFIDT